MLFKAASAVFAALVLAGCATTTPPPRFSPVSPADPDAPESVSPPPASPLANEPEARGPSPSPAPEQKAAADAPYTCVMHPEVSQAQPGVCAKCGMALVRRKGQGSRP